MSPGAFERALRIGHGELRCGNTASYGVTDREWSRTPRGREFLLGRWEAARDKTDVLIGGPDARVPDSRAVPPLPGSFLTAYLTAALPRVARTTASNNWSMNKKDLCNVLKREAAYKLPGQFYLIYKATVFTDDVLIFMKYSRKCDIWPT